MDHLEKWEGSLSRGQLKKYKNTKMWPLLACVGWIASLPRKRHEKKEAQSRIAIFGMGIGMGMGVGVSGAVVFASTSMDAKP